MKKEGKCCTKMVLTTCNAPWSSTLTLDAFLNVIGGNRPMSDWPGQMTVILNEIHPSLLIGMAEENGFPLARFTALFDQLDPLYQSAHSKSFFHGGVIVEGKYC